MKQLLKLTNEFPLTTYKSMYEYGKKKKSKAQTPNTLFNLGIT